MAGISMVGRNYYGVFPLRGKLLNVREASHKQIMENVEIQNIKHGALHLVYLKLSLLKFAICFTGLYYVPE